MNHGDAQSRFAEVGLQRGEPGLVWRGVARVVMGLGWKGAPAARGSKAFAAKSRIGGLFTFYISTSAAHMGI